MSIDGCIAGPNGEMDWMVGLQDDKINKYVIFSILLALGLLAWVAAGMARLRGNAIDAEQQRKDLQDLRAQLQVGHERLELDDLDQLPALLLAALADLRP